MNEHSEPPILIISKLVSTMNFKDEEAIKHSAGSRGADTGPNAGDEENNFGVLLGMTTRLEGQCYGIGGTK